MDAFHIKWGKQGFPWQPLKMDLRWNRLLSVKGLFNFVKPCKRRVRHCYLHFPVWSFILLDQKKSQWPNFFFPNTSRLKVDVLYVKKLSRKHKDHTTLIPTKERQQRKQKTLPQEDQREQAQSNFSMSPGPVWVVAPSLGADSPALNPLGKILALRKWMDLEVFLQGHRYYLKLCNSWTRMYSTSRSSESALWCMIQALINHTTPHPVHSQCIVCL